MKVLTVSYTPPRVREKVGPIQNLVPDGYEARRDRGQGLKKGTTKEDYFKNV